MALVESKYLFPLKIDSYNFYNFRNSLKNGNFKTRVAVAQNRDRGDFCSKSRSRLVILGFLNENPTFASPESPGFVQLYLKLNPQITRQLIKLLILI